MGGCFSSGSYEESAYGHGHYQPSRSRVRPSDEDGKWPYAAERDVDKKAAIFIANFHRQHSACTEVPRTPAPAPARAAA